MKKKTRYAAPEIIPGLSLEEPAGLYSQIQLIREGFPASVAYDLSRAYALTLQEMAGILHITVRTLQRKTEKEHLPVAVSEHLYEMKLLLRKGLEVFGKPEAFQQWLASPLMSIGNRVPKELLDTSFGIRYVSDELGRLQHGVVS